MSGKKSESKAVEAAPAGVVMSEQKTRHFQQNRRVIAVATIVLLLAIGGSVTWFMIRRNPINMTTTSTCSQETLKQAKPLLTTAMNPLQLSKLVGTIQKVKGYDRDASCLYVVTEYYISISDAKNAHTYYDKLAKVYRANVGYDKSLKDATLPLSTLKSQVDFLDQQDPAKHNLYEGPVVK